MFNALLYYKAKTLLTRFLVLHFSISSTTSRVFYDVTEASYLQLQLPCNYMHHLHLSAGLSFVSPLVFFYLAPNSRTV